jgi:hypothetical protein
MRNCGICYDTRAVTGGSSSRGSSGSDAARREREVIAAGPYASAVSVCGARNDS